MADRTGGEGNPVVPKEVFELDKDERWQARLDEARARREIALREKAAGKPQKARLKPWEIEGSSMEKPPEINPVIQERGDDKFDFADRLEAIRDTAPSDSPKDAPSPHPSAPQEPPFVPEVAAPPPFKPTQARAAAPEPRARPQPSLIMPGAPDVAELAARYAATLDNPEPLKVEPQEETKPKPMGEVVALPQSVAPQPEPKRTLTRAERRRGIRPLGMAFGLIAFAILPLTTEAPPLEVGPTMPAIVSFGLEPALGVTWSLNRTPVYTQSGDWRPAASPNAIAAAVAPSRAPSFAVGELIGLDAPSSGASGEVAWTNVAPVNTASPGEGLLPLEVPAAPQLVETTSFVPAPIEIRPLPNPGFGGEVGVTAPPKPEIQNVEDLETLAPAAAPQPRPGQMVIEGDPLRVTILAPTRSDRIVAEEIASDVQNIGHELVRVQDVEFSISERNVRYFHEEDRAAAGEIAERYEAELRDFTWFRPSPVEGTAELWLAGRAPGSAGASTSSGEEILNRLLDQLGLGIDLRR